MAFLIHLCMLIMHGGKYSNWLTNNFKYRCASEVYVKQQIAIFNWFYPNKILLILCYNSPNLSFLPIFYAFVPSNLSECVTNYFYIRPEIYFIFIWRQPIYLAAVAILHITNWAPHTYITFSFGMKLWPNHFDSH